MRQQAQTEFQVSKRSSIMRSAFLQPCCLIAFIRFFFDQFILFQLRGGFFDKRLYLHLSLCSHSSITNDQFTTIQGGFPETAGLTFAD